MVYAFLFVLYQVGNLIIHIVSFLGLAVHVLAVMAIVHIVGHLSQPVGTTIVVVGQVVYVQMAAMKVVPVTGIRGFTKNFTGNIPLCNAWFAVKFLASYKMVFMINP